MLADIGFWDVDVIPEDYRIFFKAFYKLGGQAWVEPIFLKTSMDAPLSTTYIRTLKINMTKKEDGLGEFQMINYS